VLAVVYAPAVEAIFVSCVNRQVFVYQNSREGRFAPVLTLKTASSAHSLAWDPTRRLLWCGCSNGVVYAHKLESRFSATSLLLSVRFSAPSKVLALWHDRIADLVVAVSKHGELMLFDLERKLKRVRKLDLHGRSGGGGGSSSNNKNGGSNNIGVSGGSVYTCAFDSVDHRLFVATSQRIVVFDFALRRLALIYGHQDSIVVCMVVAATTSVDSYMLSQRVALSLLSLSLCFLSLLSLFLCVRVCTMRLLCFVLDHVSTVSLCVSTMSLS
jgi:hypothetical protein